MRKNLLLGIALLASATLSAQTITWPCTLNRTSLEANTAATVDGSTTITATAATPGSDLHIQEKDGALVLATLKDATGATLMFPSEELGLIQWQPTTGNYATMDEALEAGCYVDFTIEEGDVNKDLAGIKSITFYVSKAGTDAVRINAKLIGEGDGDINSEWLINETNAYTFGDEYAGTEGGKDDPWDETVGGYNPSRNDGSKGADQGANANGLSKVTLTLPDEVKSKNPYKLTLRIAAAKTANNKSVVLYNVAFNFGEATGIQTVKNVKAEGIRYNLAGQVVDENYKGIVILNGQKMIQK